MMKQQYQRAYTHNIQRAKGLFKQATPALQKGNKQMEREKILKLLKEILELDNETLYDKENYSIFQMVERLEEGNQKGNKMDLEEYIKYEQEVESDLFRYRQFKQARRNKTIDKIIQMLERLQKYYVTFLDNNKSK